MYLTDFYVALGAPLAFLNFFTAAARSLDVLTDPVMGWASDRTRGRFGRRLPYTLSGCLVYGALFAALFSPPAAVLSRAEAGHVAPGSAAAGRAVAWFAVTYTAFYLADTWCNVPYEALGPELSDDYDERSRVFFVVKLFNQFGKKRRFFLSPRRLELFLFPLRTNKGEKKLTPALFLSSSTPDPPIHPPPSLPPPAKNTGMLLAAGLPSVAAWAIRAHGASPAIVDCAVLAAGAAPAPRGGVRLAPPRYVDKASGLCQEAATCAGGSGDYCFSDSRTGVAYEAGIAAVRSACRAALDAALAAAAAAAESGEVYPPPPGSGCRIPGLAGSSAPASQPLLLATGSAAAAMMHGGPHGHTAVTCPAGVAECVAVTAYSVSSLAAQRGAYAALSAAFGLYYAAAACVLAWRVRERPLLGEAAPRVPLVPAMMRAFKNRAFRPLLVAWALEGLGLSSLLTMAPFFVRYVVEADGAAAAARGQAMDPTACLGGGVMLLLVVALLASPAWLAASRRWGKFRVWIVVSAAAALSNVLFLVPLRGRTRLTIAIMALNGAAVGGQFLTNSILADVIDYDEFLHGARSEASFSVFATIIPKFLSIPASAIPLAIVNSLGFAPPVDGVSQPQAASVRGFISAAFVAIPVLSAAVSLFFKLRFPIRSAAITDALQAGIAAHNAGRAATDPLTGLETHLLALGIDGRTADDERADVWRYECFPLRLLDDLLDTGGDSRAIVREMGIHVALSSALLAGCVGGTAATARWISDDRLSVVPVLGAICTGASLCYAAVSAARLRTATRLGVGDAGRHAGLIARVRSVKAGGGGGAGGGDGEARATLLQEALTGRVLSQGRLSRRPSGVGSLASGFPGSRRPSSGFGGGGLSRAASGAAPPLGRISGLASSRRASGAAAGNGGVDKAISLTKVAVGAAPSKLGSSTSNTPRGAAGRPATAAPASAAGAATLPVSASAVSVAAPPQQPSPPVVVPAPAAARAPPLTPPANNRSASPTVSAAAAAALRRHARDKDKEEEEGRR